MASKATTAGRSGGRSDTVTHRGVTILKPPFPPTTSLSRIRKAVREVYARERDGRQLAD